MVIVSKAALVVENMVVVSVANSIISHPLKEYQKKQREKNIPLLGGARGGFVRAEVTLAGALAPKS